HQIEVIVVGYNIGTKQGINIGKANNQNFVTIPCERFLFILKVVGCQYGMPVAEQEESYTSKASLLDLDEIPVYGKEDTDAVVFSGQRAKRGMYLSREGKIISADINGAGNILRKAYPHAFDGVDMGYLCSAVSVITGEQILHKKQKPPVKHYRRHRSDAGKVRHFYRQEKRMQLRMVWDNRDDTFKKRNRPAAKATA
ncbi:transposase, partial [Ruminococcus sp. CLA-AA-H200]|nr:transposase [Ruminococcus turbiniformis]